MRTTLFTPFLLIAVSLFAGWASSSCSAASDESAPLAPRESGKMHYMHSEQRLPGVRDYLVLSQNHCVDERVAAKLPAVPRLTKETIDPRMWVVTSDAYISSDRVASYTRSYEEVHLSDACAFIRMSEIVRFESQFADGRKIIWSRSDGVYHARIEKKQDLSELRKAISELLRGDKTSRPSGQSAVQAGMDKILAATGRHLKIAGIPCSEYRIPAMNATICSVQVSDPIPMIDCVGQNSLILSLSITADVIRSSDTKATKVLLSLPIDQSVFDPKSL